MAKVPPTNNNRFIKDMEWDPNNPPAINTCNNKLVGEDHAPACDGNCDVAALTELDVLITNEYRAWERAGMNTSMIQVDLFGVDMNVGSLLDLLIEKGIIDKEEWMDLKRRNTLEKLRTIRANIEPQMRRARIAANPGIIGPNGEIFG